MNISKSITSEKELKIKRSDLQNIYENVDDLSDKLNYFKNNDDLRRNYAEKGKEKYFRCWHIG